MRSRAMVFRVAILAAGMSGCHAGGEYAGSARGDREGAVDRGETNGRTFDFVSNKPDGDDWEIRVRGSSLWASYGNRDKVKSLAPVNLDRKETAKVWKLIDALDLATRKKGKKDEDDGFVTLVLREPDGDDGQHQLHTVYMSRDSGDEDLEKLAIYLQDLIKKHHKVDADF